MSPLFPGSFLFASLFLDTLETKEPEPQKKRSAASRHKKAKISEAQNGIPHNVEDVPDSFPALSAKPRDFCSKDGSFKYICFSASMDILTTSLFLAEELCLSIPYSLCPPTKKTRSWVLCVNWWKKSGDHQLMLVVYRVIYQRLTGFRHLRWFSRRISEPSTVCQARWLFFFFGLRNPKQPPFGWC